MKETYQQPEIEVVELGKYDILNTSGPTLPIVPDEG